MSIRLFERGQGATSFPGLFPFELRAAQKGKALGTRLGGGSREGEGGGE